MKKNHVIAGMAMTEKKSITYIIIELPSPLK